MGFLAENAIDMAHITSMAYFQTQKARLVAKIAQDEKYYSAGKVILKRIKAKEQLQLAKHNLPIDSILG